MWTTNDVHQTYLDYFASHGHRVVPSSSLIPRSEDQTVLLTTAGMQQMTPYFLGRETPPAQRLTSSQKCFRTVDIDRVGNQRTLTFFEMLGNFSVNDYFKPEAVAFAWELCADVFKIDLPRLWVTVHPDDHEAEALWRQVGMPSARITHLEDNWWEPGPVGPCGFDSELYIDRGEALGCGQATCAPGCDCERFLEFWNLVFMQYYQDGKGGREPLGRQNIDTGMGLERTTMLLQGKQSVYDTDAYLPIIEEVAERAGRRYGQDASTDTALRVIADHGRGSAFLIADGVLPGNEGRGYVLRRLLRRAVRYGRLLGIERDILAPVAERVTTQLGDAYPELRNRLPFMERVLRQEEARFSQTLHVGLNLLDDVIAQLKERQQTVIAGAEAFRLHDTHGFPLELTQELAAEQGFTVDAAGFGSAMADQQRKSKASLAQFRRMEEPALAALGAMVTERTTFTGYQTVEDHGAVRALVADGATTDIVYAPREAVLVVDRTPFYAEAGGQVGDTGDFQTRDGRFRVRDTKKIGNGLYLHFGQVADGFLREGDELRAQVDAERRADIRRNHSATHLLHKALRMVLGEGVRQAGSLVDADHLRFDFTYLGAPTHQEVREIERLVNEKVRENLTVDTAILPLREALATGAMALFDEKYGDQVRVVSMSDFSKELCGGTHCARTGDIGLCLITSESSIGAGLRRIEAITGAAAERAARAAIDEVAVAGDLLTPRGAPLLPRLQSLLAENESLRKQQSRLRLALAQSQSAALLESVQQVNGAPVLAARLALDTVELLREMGDWLRDRLPGAVLVLATVVQDKPSLVAFVAPELVARGVHAGNLLRQISAIVGGSAGGRPEAAQGGGKDAARLDEALGRAPDLVRTQLGG